MFHQLVPQNLQMHRGFRRCRWRTAPTLSTALLKRLKSGSGKERNSKVPCICIEGLILPYCTFTSFDVYLSVAACIQTYPKYIQMYPNVHYVYSWKMFLKYYMHDSSTCIYPNLNTFSLGNLGPHWTSAPPSDGVLEKTNHVMWCSSASGIQWHG